MTTTPVELRRVSPREPRDLVLRAILVIGCGLPLPSSAFKVGVIDWPPIHETITAEAINASLPAADPRFVINVRSGVFNTDFSHQPEAGFHFDNSQPDDANGGFTNGFNTLHGMLAQAASEASLCDVTNHCVTNPLFLNPQHTSYRDHVESIVGTYLGFVTNSGCLEEPACPTDLFAAGAADVQSEVLPILLEPDYPDPDSPNPLAATVSSVKLNLDILLGPRCRPAWSFSSQCFDRLEDMAPSDNDFQLLAGQLRILQYEYQAYFAWQHLGHAFHTTQDFFAHSNYVELASCRRGPPCDPTAANAANVCDSPIGSPPPQVPVGAIPLPTDGNLAWSLAQFQSVFNLATVQATLNRRPRVFADDNSHHLQTGYFPCPDIAPPGGFAYCHTPGPAVGTAPSPGMNKDEPASEPNEQNYLWARASAVRLSAALFGAFMGSLPGINTYLNPDFSNFVAVAAYPSGVMPGLCLHSGSVPLAVIPYTTRSLPQLTPPAANSVAAPPASALVRPAVLRTLPPLTRPELVQTTAQPHVFVRVSPNRAFQVGEQLSLVVNAFDGRSGAALPGLPVVIGGGRGLTGSPMTLTVQPQFRQRCGTYGGQPFCLNEWDPPSGTVLAPANLYPASGSTFTLSVVIPQMLVSMRGGPAIKPGTTGFMVLAIDAHTHLPVRGAEVLLGGRVIGAANQPIALSLQPTVTYRPLGKTGAQALAAAHGPPLIARAPGYSDALVYYAISSAAP